MTSTNQTDTTSAATGNDEKKSKIIIECKQSDKAKWVKHCANNKIKLSDFIINTLNKSLGGE